ncbi:helix-turn-helix domain-containing protein [Mycobacterium sp. ITM-2016-00318]|uniref:helix-turn-helix domain-containing protein n=1 Tax=Mycobacterium sp. ITM-2016-00318 TaxID=2099693 RepID=UPI001E564BAE|nr:helix-turn-helix transcriptional regulator [Mycobacterium sp. ITM-2016-00318]WNG92652.1 helix-turn-helix transcriptional regulator [Mycobacterium sp. ITM-2016-00318]
MTQHWSEGLHQRIARAIRDARQGRMSAQELADETQQLGYPITRSQIANYESGRKQTLDVAELLVIAAALEVPPVTLLFGGPPDEEVEMLPGWTGPAFFGIAWFSGDRELAWPGPEVIDPDEARAMVDQVIANLHTAAARLLWLTRKRAAVHSALVESRVVSKMNAKAWSDDQFDAMVRRDARLIEEIDEISDEIAKAVAESEGQTE